MDLKKNLLLFFVLNHLLLFSQNVISGEITDDSNAPLPYSNVVLYQADKTLVSGTVSDEGGRYSFRDIPNGSYLLEVSLLGFQTQESKPFSISDNDKVELDFILKEDIQTLDEVFVKTNRPVIRQTTEKLIVDIENSEIQSSNLQDVMKKVPGIIAINGKLSYGGQQNVRILINGKTTAYMDTASLLRDMPAENIAKIELIHQPGAEFDAEGSGPLINIILKKNIKLGTNGNIKVYQGYDNQYEYATSAFVSNFKNRLNWQLSTGYSKYTQREDLFLKRKVNNDVYDQSSISPFDPKTSRISGELSFYLNDYNTIGVHSRLANTNSDRITSNITRVVKISTIDVLSTENHFDRERVVFNVSPYYKFDDDKNNFVLDFNFVNYQNDNINNLYKIGESSIDYNNQRYFQKGKYKIITFKIDYKRTVGDNFTWMSGAKYSVVNTDNDLVSFYQNNNDVFVLDDNQSNRFFIDESIIAFYAKLNYNINKWAFSGGLRWEESKTSGTSTNPRKTKRRKISRFFPSSSVSRKITETLGINLSYSYRIQRPSYNSLNSFVFYYDPYTFEEGNPNLSPSFTNNTQLSLTFEEKPFFSIGYRNTSNALFEIISQNDTTAQTSRSVINIGNYKNWNFRIFAPVSFVDNLDGFSGFIVNHNQVNSSDLKPPLNLSKWSLTWYTNVEYVLPWGINSELSGYYTSGGLLGQIEHEWIAGLSFAMSKTFMNEKLKANVGIGEILNRQFKGTVNYNNVDADIITDWSRQNVYLQITYKFGEDFRKRKAENVSSEEEEDRIQDNN